MLRTTLDNGLKVILVEDHSAPVVALNVWVRTGSADERPDQWGMAHLHEHMLFKGTDKYGVGQIAATVEGAGGNINAFTSYDMTVYHITMASKDAPVGVDVLSDAVLHSGFDATELAKEEEVVIEEIRRSDDSPDSLMSKVLFETAYTQHPYRREVIGTQESVRSFTRQGLLDFYHHWYVPNNMTFVAVGDLKADAMLAQIKAAFAGAKPAKDLVHTRTSEPAQTAARAAVVKSEFEQSLLGIAWKATSFGDTDTPYLDLLASVLGGGESSRLYREVKDRQELVHGIHASSYTPLDPGLFFVDAELDAANIDQSVAAIGDQVRRLRDFGPSQTELDRARTNVMAAQVHERETMMGQAQKYGYFELLAGGIEAEQRYLDQVKRATVADLQRVAQKYLVSRTATVVALLGKDAKGEATSESALLASLERGSSGESAPLAAQTLRDGIREYKLPNGLRVVVKANHSVPLVSLRLAFRGGVLAESEKNQGITSFVADMLTRGTQSRSSAQLAADVENIAADLSGFSGRNSFGLQGDFLAESLDQGLDLFADVLLHPSFDPQEIDKQRVERRAALRRREDNLGTKAFEAFQQELYPKHPYRFSSLGTDETVGKFDRRALSAYWQALAQPDNAVLGVVGDVDPDRFVESLRLRLSEWKATGKAALPARTTPTPPIKARETSKAKHKNQSHIVYGFLGLSVDDPDVAALDVLTQVLGGQGGRLFVELRDKQSLAYSITAFEMEGIDPGTFAVYMAGAPSKLDESLAGIRSELSKIVNEPVGADELSRAKGYLIGSQAVSLQSYGAQAMLLSLDELYGLGATHHLDYQARVSAVSADDVQRVAKRVIRLDAPVVAIIK
ncbi:MAG TPA: pitrilysin family protein [Myxococcota bacterium]|nr:pitrilysin family protein [Myxococcota bacterium]